MRDKTRRDCLWWVGGIKQAEKRRDKHEMETILEEKVQSEMREKMRDYRRQNEMRRNEVRHKVRRDWKRSRKKRQDWMRRDESKWNKTRKDKKMRGVSGVIQTQILKPHLIWWPWKATYCIYCICYDYRLSMGFIYCSSDQASSWLYWRSVLSHLLCYLSSVNEIRPCGCWLASPTLTD